MTGNVFDAATDDQATVAAAARREGERDRPSGRLIALPGSSVCVAEKRRAAARQPRRAHDPALVGLLAAVL